MIHIPVSIHVILIKKAIKIKSDTSELIDYNVPQAFSILLLAKQRQSVGKTELGLRKN